MGRIGDRDKLIMFQRAVKTRDSIGAVVPSWTNLAQLWSSFKPLPGKEIFNNNAQREVSTRQAIVNTLYVGSLTTADRAVVDGQAWDIVSIRELGRRSELEFAVERRE